MPPVLLGIPGAYVRGRVSFPLAEGGAHDGLNITLSRKFFTSVLSDTIHKLFRPYIQVSNKQHCVSQDEMV